MSPCSKRSPAQDENSSAHPAQGAKSPALTVGQSSLSRALQVLFIPAVNSSSGMLTVLAKLFWLAAEGINKFTCLGTAPLNKIHPATPMALPGSSLHFRGEGGTRVWACALFWNLGSEHSAIHIVTANITVEFLTVWNQLRVKGQFVSGFLFNE